MGLLFLIDAYPSFGPDPLDWLEWFGLGFVSSLYIGRFAAIQRQLLAVSSTWR